MATNVEVLKYLRPNGGYVQYGEEYEGIQFIEAEPFSKEEYIAAFELADLAKEQALAENEAKRQAILNRLNITAEEAKLILS